MNDLVSVIVPIYNVEQYLTRCVDSVIRQTYINMEIILVDDGSPDCSGDICDALAANDARIRVIHKKNGGLSDARNAALDICSGEYICFVDSDDYIADDFIESLYGAIKQYGTKLAICGIMRVDEYGHTSEDYVPSRVADSVSGLKMFETVWRPAACNKMYHRSLFDGIRYPFGKLYEDLFIYHEILARVDKVAFSGKNSYYYFNRQSSIMNKKFDIRNLDLVEGLDLRINKLRELGYYDLADQQLSFVFNTTVRGYVCLTNKDLIVKKRKEEAKKTCIRHFPEMMEYKGFTFPQKARIALFCFFTRLYLLFYKSGL